MSTRRDPRTCSPRTFLRCGVLLGSVAFLLATAGPAGADTPIDWDDVPEVSGFAFLTVVLLIPLALAAVIAFLAALPTLIGRNRGYQAGQAWRGDDEWFGGPTAGVKAADEVDAETLASAERGSGGASGRW